MNHHVVHFQFDRSKFKETVLYICAHCEASNLGSVKLHKALYFADMLKYVWDGQPITGEIYRKSPLGPTSHHLFWTLKQLEQEGAIETKEVEHFGYLKKEYIAKRAPDESRFEKSELQLLDDIIDFVCRKNTAKDISEISHTRAWEIVNFGDEIPYHSAFLIYPHMVSEEAIEWAQQEASKIADQRSKQGSVDHRSLRDFRARLLEGAP